MKIITKIDRKVLKRTIQRARERGVILPTFAQQKNPRLIPLKIQNRLGISLSGAKSRVQRGREQLKQMLLERCEFEFQYCRSLQAPYESEFRSCRSCKERYESSSVEPFVLQEPYESEFRS